MLDFVEWYVDLHFADTAACFVVVMIDMIVVFYLVTRRWFVVAMLLVGALVGWGSVVVAAVTFQLHFAVAAYVGRQVWNVIWMAIGAALPAQS